jgi:hypothetical protein
VSNRITALLLALFFGLFALLNLVLPDHLFSEYENRYLQEWPDLSFKTLFSGYFGDMFNVYIQDQFPVRDAWISLKTFSEMLVGKKDNGRVYFGKDGYLLLIGSKPDKKLLDKNLAALSKLFDELADKQKDLRSFLLFVPSAAEVMPDLLPAYAPGPDTSAVMNAALAYLGHKAFLIDSLAALQSAAKNKGQLYYRTDHHWTTGGAYVVYQAWARALGFEPLQQDDFRIDTVSKSFYGTCWSQGHGWSCKPDAIESWQTEAQCHVTIRINGSEKPDGKLYDPAFLNKKDKYAYFLGGNYATVDVTTGIHNGRTLLLIKDSYANAFIPFLTQHYERILVVDPRHLNMNLEDCLQKLAGFVPTDLLLLCSLDQFASDASYAKLAAG